MNTNKSYSCKLCKKAGITDETWDNRRDLLRHYKQVHPEHITYKHTPKQTGASPSAVETVTAAISTIRSSIKQLEYERDLLSQKILDLDNLISKYKKLV